MSIDAILTDWTTSLEHAFAKKDEAQTKCTQDVSIPSEGTNSSVAVSPLS